MLYIQRKGNGYLETVDEFETREEARAMLREYRMCDPIAGHYISSRACKAWRNNSQQSMREALDAHKAKRAIRETTESKQ